MSEIVRSEVIIALVGTSLGAFLGFIGSLVVMLAQNFLKERSERCERRRAFAKSRIDEIRPFIDEFNFQVYSLVFWAYQLFAEASQTRAQQPESAVITPEMLETQEEVDRVNNRLTALMRKPPKVPPPTVELGILLLGLVAAAGEVTIAVKKAVEKAIKTPPKISKLSWLNAVTLLVGLA